jgi:hypothetical protein
VPAYGLVVGVVGDDGVELPQPVNNIVNTLAMTRVRTEEDERMTNLPTLLPGRKEDDAN